MKADGTDERMSIADVGGNGSLIKQVGSRVLMAGNGDNSSGLKLLVIGICFISVIS